MTFDLRSYTVDQIRINSIRKKPLPSMLGPDLVFLSMDVFMSADTHYYKL